MNIKPDFAKPCRTRYQLTFWGVVGDALSLIAWVCLIFAFCVMLTPGIWE